MCHTISQKNDQHYFDVFNTRSHTFVLGKKTFILSTREPLLESLHQNYFYKPIFLKKLNCFKFTEKPKKQYVQFNFNTNPQLSTPTIGSAIKKFYCGFHISPLYSSDNLICNRVIVGLDCFRFTVPVAFRSNDILFFDGTDISVRSFYIFPFSTFKHHKKSITEKDNYKEFYNYLRRISNVS